MRGQDRGSPLIIGEFGAHFVSLSHGTRARRNDSGPALKPPKMTLAELNAGRRHCNFTYVILEQWLFPFGEECP